MGLDEFQEFEEILHDSRKTCSQYQYKDYMHITNIAQYLLVQYQRNGTSTKFNVYLFVWLLYRFMNDILYHFVLNYDFKEEEFGNKYYLQMFYAFVYFNTCRTIIKVYVYMQKGIYTLTQKYLCLIQFSNMLCQKNQ